MRANRLKTLWREGRPAASGWLAIPAPFSAEIMAHQGWDALTIDLQHGLIDYQAAVAMLTAISTTETVPLVRVPWLEVGPIMKLLDAGAYGIICPMVNTREDAEKLVRAGRYPPAGTRSFGPVRAAIYGGADYVENANDEIVLMAMIETEEALDNVKEIAAVPGLDGLFIGPNDLAKSLGRASRLDTDDPVVAPAIAHIIDTAAAAGIACGIFAGAPDYAARIVRRGARFVAISSDARLLAAAAAATVARFRDAGEA